MNKFIYMVQHLRAHNSPNGNPQRLYAVYEAGTDFLGQRQEAKLVNIYDEGYRGEPAAVKNMIHLPDVAISKADYHELKRFGEKHYKNPRRKSMADFIAENKADIDAGILRAMDRSPSEYRLNNEERRQWILNDEGLYRWARSEGVNI